MVSAGTGDVRGALFTLGRDLARQDAIPDSASEDVYHDGLTSLPLYFSRTEQQE